MSGPGADSAIERYLDELLRGARTEPRATRRLLEEAQDHLLATAADLESEGMGRGEAEAEAVRRMGPPDVLAGPRPSVWLLALEVLRAAILLGGWGLVAVGFSGGVAAVMNAVAGSRFVGGSTVLGTGGSSVAEGAHDAVALRVLTGMLGVAVLAGYAMLRRHADRASVVPPSLVDTLGAAAFAAATVVLAGASVDQAVSGVDAHGVGFFASGAIVSLVGAVVFGARAARGLLRQDGGRQASRWSTSGSPG